MRSWKSGDMPGELPLCHEVKHFTRRGIMRFTFLDHIKQDIQINAVLMNLYLASLPIFLYCNYIHS